MVACAEIGAEHLGLATDYMRVAEILHIGANFTTLPTSAM